MKTRMILETIVVASQTFQESAKQIGWDKNSLEDFMKSIEFYLASEISKEEK